MTTLMFFSEIIESKSNGIFTLLDEESKLPKPSFDHFTSEVHKAWNGHFRLSLPRTSRLKIHRNLKDEEGFLVRHFAGAVCYTTVRPSFLSLSLQLISLIIRSQSQFIEKNNDALHASLEALVQESMNPLVKNIFPMNQNQSSRGKLNFISVGSKFKTQLAELMEKLEKNVCSSLI